MISFLQASETVNLNLFNTSAQVNLLEKTKELQVRKMDTMKKVMEELGTKFELVEPITDAEFKPFLDALFPN